MTRGAKRGRPQMVLQSSTQPTTGMQLGEAPTPSPSLSIPEENLEEQINETVLIFSSYASMVDPEEGTELKFVPTQIINGVKCAKLDKDDVAAETEYWQNTVLCSVLGAKPLFEIIHGFIKHICATLGIDKIIQVRKGVFLVRFGNLQDKQLVKKHGVYYFDAKPFLVKGWNPETDMHIETIKFIPLWVQFPNLNLKYWGAESLSKIGSILGIPIKTDRYAKEKSVIQYAGLLIDIPLEGPFPDFIEFFNDNDVLQVRYEWKPTKCTYCHMFGYEEELCKKKKGGTLQEERNEKRSDKLVGQAQTKEFTCVLKMPSARQPVQVTTNSTPLHINPFQVKEKNESKVVEKTFPGWLWQHNFALNATGYIWIAWKPSTYDV
ncbi:LOW QUALITY PROTEIN: hypothetical protein Cgig2_004265 [Carnegiea gigantea]|uniref:DUF4283 domain-containing protein n=1 Tax=Carnegiea gigantea TaxID=171969 RepID=A0A9Q1KGE1_9CARY|nr:LOW QUALITY PROTEIN: hypothetical protein Cgig2_004265 [Carnegiea gigantea]